ncbi:major capsid protein [Metabacillus dongyingensis]|uniref:major capsid protein n=1 Tax=Metabacillus dongyingensis TaxID=2874282 RepID=UPI001CBA9CA8|nr:hypothetical protein [Metabacillus dongyingensis]UAL53513.1 hypothetical protein K8L98_06930 [Metabacillus dongyingensis]
MTGILLSEASKLTATPLKKGVIETIMKESSVLEKLPFVDISGNAFSFAREKTDGGATFRDVNESYPSNMPTYENLVESLRLLGSKVEVDRYFELTQNIHEVRAEATESKIKAIANEFTRVFFKGNAAVNPLEFNGIDQHITAKNTITVGNKRLVTPMVDALLDCVDGADMLYMNKRTRRHLTGLFGVQGAYVQQGQDSFGRFVSVYADTKIGVLEDSMLPDNEIYAVKFGEGGVVGIQNGELQVEDNGLRGTMYETLIEWYVSTVMFNPKGVAKLTGFNLEDL